MEEHIQSLYGSFDSYIVLKLVSNPFIIPDRGWGETIKDYIKSYITSISDYLPSKTTLAAGASAIAGTAAGTLGLGG